MKCWKFEILEKCPDPIVQIPAKEMGFENAHPLPGSHFLKFPQKMGFEKSEVLEQAWAGLGPSWTGLGLGRPKSGRSGSLAISAMSLPARS